MTIPLSTLFYLIAVSLQKTPRLVNKIPCRRSWKTPPLAWSTKRIGGTTIPGDGSKGRERELDLKARNTNWFEAQLIHLVLALADLGPAIHHVGRVYSYLTHLPITVGCGCSIFEIFEGLLPWRAQPANPTSIREPGAVLSNNVSVIYLVRC